MRRFPIRITTFNRTLAIAGLRPKTSWVDVDDESISVRMGWAFRFCAPRSSITSVAEDHGRVLGWGVHGWRGQWLVNGSSDGLVRIEFEPAGRAWTTGVPVKVRRLRVSVGDPAGLVAALTGSSRTHDDLLP